FDAHLALLDPERVAKRNELVRSLRCHCAGDDRSVKYGSFRRREAVRAQSMRDGFGKAHPRFGNSDAVSDALGSNVDHRWRAVDVDVRELGHGQATLSMGTGRRIFLAFDRDQTLGLTG